MIHVEGDWYISVDQYSYTLMKRTGTNKKGEPTYDNLRYFRSLREAVLGYVRISASDLLSRDEMALSEALRRLQAHFSRIDELLRGATNGND